MIEEQERIRRGRRLLEGLDEAFPTDPVPSRFPSDLSNDEAFCDASFGGKRWDEVEDAEAVRGSDCFGYFTPEQARYYLPAFLRAVLRDLPEGTDGSLLYGSFWIAMAHARRGGALFQGLTDEQRRCVAEFLFLISEWLWPSGNDEERSRTARAAAQLWAGETGGPYDIESELPEALRQERSALVIEIREAFAGVMRRAGVSWKETVEIDLYGNSEARFEARDRDPDRPWGELLDDPTWEPEKGVGGWGYLDPLGVRYYLPAGMIRRLREGVGWTLEYLLFIADWEEGADLPERFSALSFRQIKCVGWFVRTMAAWADAYYAEDPTEKGRWAEAASGFWRTVDSWPDES